jgi:hypothetical protein
MQKRKPQMLQNLAFSREAEKFGKFGTRTASKPAAATKARSIQDFRGDFKNLLGDRRS